jgi:hypothetical protein
MHSEETRVNVDRSAQGTSMVRLLAAGLVLLVCGWIVLSLSTRSRTAAATPLESSLASPVAFARNLPAQKSGDLTRAHNLFAGLPLVFEPNEGQTGLNPADSHAFFIARGPGYTLLLGSQGATLNLVSGHSTKHTLSKHDTGLTHIESLQMKFARANPHPGMTASGRLSGVSNYFLGSDRSRWRSAIPQFARVNYENVYSGINLVFYGNQGHLEYDFQVAPGADPAQAELEFDGAKRLELNHGDLVIHGENGSLRLAAPVVYQQSSDRREPIAAKFVLRGRNRAGFAIGSYDHSRELVIDPVLAFSTYFGGSGDELNSFVAIDGSGNIYIAGSTTSPNLPVSAGVVQSTLSGAQNLFIAKIVPPLISPTGAASLAYVTYLGGSGSDTPVGIGVDAAGDAFVAGTTTSTNFPTTASAYQTSPEPGSSGTQHVFVTEVVGPDSTYPAQKLYYSTYLSGSGNDIATGMTIDSQGFVYVTGTTTSLKPQDYAVTSQFPVTNIPNTLPFQNIPRSPVIQFFVTKVFTQAAHQGSVYYSTYFGGGSSATTSPIAVGGNIAVDPTGNIYFTGTTNFIYTGSSPTSDFPILNAYQPCLDQAPPLVYVNPPTCSNTSTTSNTDGFVAKLNPNPVTTTSQASQLLWSTYLGGTGTDSLTGIGLDSGAVNVYVTGTTDSPGLGVAANVTNAGTYQHCLDSPKTPANTACPTINPPVPTDAFVGRLTNPTVTTGTSLVNVALNYFSYLGGSGNDAGTALTVDTGNGAVVTGWTQSTDFPIFPTPQDGIQSTLNGPQDAFIARLYTNVITGQNTTSSWATYFGGTQTEQGTGVALDSNGAVYVAGQTNSPDLLVEKPLPSNEGGAYNGGYDTFLTQLTSASSLSVTGTLLLGPNQTYISAGNQATFTYIVTNNGPDLANTVIVSDDVRPLTTVIPVQFASATASSGICGGGSNGQSVSCNIPTLQAGSTAIVTIILTPTATATGNAATFNGGTVTATAVNNVTPAETSVSALMSDYALSVTPANVTVQAGFTASYQVQLTPHPVYATPIALSVTGLPIATNAVFTATPITLQGTSPGSTILNIGTTTRPINTIVSLFTRHFYAIWLPIPGMALFGLGSGGRRRRRIFGWMMFYWLLALIVFLPSCSGQIIQPPATGTPAGTYTLTVTATSGTDSKSQSIVLTVQ